MKVLTSSESCLACWERLEAAVSTMPAALFVGGCVNRADILGDLLRSLPTADPHLLGSNPGRMNDIRPFPDLGANKCREFLRSPRNDFRSLLR